MRRLVLGLASAVLFACAASPGENEVTARANAQAPETRVSGVVEQRFDGPGLVCGAAFGLVLRPDEHLVSRDPQLDFATYRIDGHSGGFVLYEGKAPQSSDDRIETGLAWPAIIAIHGEPNGAGQRPGRIRDRLILGDRRQVMCGTAPPGR